MIDVRQVDHTRGQVEHYLLEVPQRKRVDALRRLAQLDDFCALVFFKQTFAPPIKDKTFSSSNLAHGRITLVNWAANSRSTTEKGKYESKI